MALVYGFSLFFIAWLAFNVDPYFDTSWFNEMLGFSDLEGKMATMFLTTGFLIGVVADKVSRIGKAHDRLVDKIYDRDS